MSQNAAAVDGCIDEVAERPAGGGGLWWCVALIVLGGVAAYHNSLRGPFLFDDEPSIKENPTIRHLWPPGPMLNPPANGEAVQRRPVANVSLAINYAFGGLSVWGYHATNLGLHILAALALLGVVRRTLESPRLRARFGEQALGLATAIAGLWVVHPLLTDAVTYVIQRTEILAGLFYLLTLYAVIRGVDSPSRMWWYIGAVAACLLAMGSKEAAISAPVVVLIYDRIFLAGSWREVFGKRWRLYVALAATWAVVLAVLPHGNEGSNILGVAQARVQYALAQGEIIVHYLTLCFWPASLAVDYGFCPPQTLGGALPYLAGVAALLAGTVWAFWRRAELAFLGVWFFAILAPSSSIVPLVQQVGGEKRMYLPLAAVVALVVLGGWAIWRGLARRWARPGAELWLAAVPIALAALAGVALGSRTVARNDDYRTVKSLWQSAVAAKPENPRALTNLGASLGELGRYKEAIPYYEKALRIKPDHLDAQYDWGNALLRTKQYDEAIVHYQEAVRIDPHFANAHYQWGVALGKLKRYPEAEQHFKKALELAPGLTPARESLKLLQKLMQQEHRPFVP